MKINSVEYMTYDEGVFGLRWRRRKIKQGIIVMST